MAALAEKIAQITPGRLEKSFFTLVRLRGQRDRHRLRAHAHRQHGDRRSPPLLLRPHRAHPLAHRHCRLAQGLLSGRHRPRDEPVLLSLPAGQDLPLLRGRLRAGHRSRHPVLHLRRHRRHDRRTHPGRRRLHHPAQRVLQDRLLHRQEIRRRLHRRRGADRLGPHRQRLVRHRALGGRARHPHRRQVARQRISHRPHRRHAGDRQRLPGPHHRHLRRQPRRLRHRLAPSSTSSKRTTSSATAMSSAATCAMACSSCSASTPSSATYAAWA